jgi:predicted metal-binding transcription factor (methanogenesis marker protein 9)
MSTKKPCHNRDRKMINLKQKELSHQLFDQLKQQYSELDLVDIVESGVYPDHLWVKIAMPEDEDREIAMGKLASDISTDILIDYGSHITISSASRAEKVAVASVGCVTRTFFRRVDTFFIIFKIGF